MAALLLALLGVAYAAEKPSGGGGALDLHALALNSTSLLQQADSQTPSYGGLTPTVLCPAGQYKAGGVCRDCLVGRFSSKESDRDFCERCVPGKFAAAPRALKCELCPGGYYSGSDESAACTKCEGVDDEEGEDALQKAATLTAGRSSCYTACPVAQFNFLTDKGTPSFKDMESQVFSQVTEDIYDNAGYPADGNPNAGRWDKAPRVFPTEETLKDRVYPVGDTRVTFTLTDFADNTAECDTIVRVADGEQPTWVPDEAGNLCPPDVVIAADESCSAVFSWANPTASDNVASIEEGTLTVAGPFAKHTSAGKDASALLVTSPHKFDLGSTIVAYSASDSATDPIHCSFKVTVEDRTDPTISCSTDDNEEMYRHSCGKVPDGGLVVTYGCTAQDNCAAATGAEPAPKCSEWVGFTEPQLTGDEYCADSEAEWNCEVGDLATCLGYCADFLYCSFDTEGLDGKQCCARSNTCNKQATADNRKYKMYYSGKSGDRFPVAQGSSSEFIVSCTVEDEAGNSGADEIKFGVADDHSDPKFVSCPSSQTIELAQGVEKTKVEYDLPVAESGCVLHVFEVNGRTQDDLLTAGVHEYLYMAEDDHGNAGRCVFTVTVKDNTFPEWDNCPRNGVFEYTIPHHDFAIVSWTLPTATKYNKSLTDGYDYGQLSPGLAYPLGKTNIVYTVTDNVNHTTLCEFVVEVYDNEEPNLYAPELLGCDEGSHGAAMHEQCGGKRIVVEYYNETTRLNTISKVVDVTAQCCNSENFCKPMAGYESADFKYCSECEWVASSTCAWDGVKDLAGGKRCNQKIGNMSAGFCSCGDGRIAGKSSCESKNFETCKEACTQKDDDTTCAWRSEAFVLDEVECPAAPEGETDGVAFRAECEGAGCIYEEKGLGEALQLSCSPKSTLTREPEKDKSCNAEVELSDGGYCECDGEMQGKFGTGLLKPFATCKQACYEKDFNEACMWRATQNGLGSGPVKAEPSSKACKWEVTTDASGYCDCGRELGKRVGAKDSGVQPEFKDCYSACFTAHMEEEQQNDDDIDPIQTGECLNVLGMGVGGLENFKVLAEPAGSALRSFAFGRGFPVNTTVDGEACMDWGTTGTAFQYVPAEEGKTQGYTDHIVVPSLRGAQCYNPDQDPRGDWCYISKHADFNYCNAAGTGCSSGEFSYTYTSTRLTDTEGRETETDSVFFASEDSVLKLKGLNVRCEESELLAGFQLSKDLGNKERKYQYTCLQESAEATSCVEMETELKDVGPTGAGLGDLTFLEGHSVSCGAWKYLQGFKVKSAGSRIKYAYTCCDPKVQPGCSFCETI